MTGSAWLHLLGPVLAGTAAFLLAGSLAPGQRRGSGQALLVLLAGVVAQPAGMAVAALGAGLAGETLQEVGSVVTGLALIRLWGVALLLGLLPRVGVATPRIVVDIVLAIGYLGWGLVRLRHAGMDLGSIVTTSAIVTAVVAFAIQDTLGNLLGGLALQLDKSVRLGDWIKVGDVNGRVTDIRWRYTAVETRNWETIVVPNSRLVKGEFLVLGRRRGEPEQWRRWVWFNVGLNTSPARVIEAVEGAIRSAAIPGVARKPLANCVLMDFDPSGYGRYALRYWLTDLYADDPTDSAVRGHIYAALQRDRIRLAVPEQRVNVVQKDREHAEEVADRELQRRVTAIRGVSLFAALNDAEMTQLARRLRYAPFAAGDVMTRQGDEAHWLYIITGGGAVVYLESPGERREVARLGAGSFFGEAGLMTGAPRTATVVASHYTECYRLDKEAFEDILLARPAIAHDISQVLAVRQQELAQARRTAEGAVAGGVGARTPVAEWLRRIQHFFGLDETGSG